MLFPLQFRNFCFLLSFSCSAALLMRSCLFCVGTSGAPHVLVPNISISTHFEDDEELPHRNQPRRPQLCSVCGHERFGAYSMFHAQTARKHADGCSQRNCKGCNPAFCTVSPSQHVIYNSRKHRKVSASQ